MTRTTVRSLKRALQAGTRAQATVPDRLLSSESARALLERSIHFGHGRLAVVGLSIAVNAGAELQNEHWVYCSRVAHACKDWQLQELYLSAALKAMRHEARG